MYSEGLPQELRDESPLRVLEYLQMRGKATRSELIRILEGIKRHDAAQKIAVTLDDNFILTKELASNLSAQIKHLMTLAEGTREESKVAVIAECMDQLNHELKNSGSPLQNSRRHYCPRDDELRTARRKLRPRGEHNA